MTIVQSHSIIVRLSGIVVVTLSDKLRLQKTPNRAARVLTYSSYDADANELMKILGWKNLETQRQIHKAQMVYKSLHGLAPN